MKNMGEMRAQQLQTSALHGKGAEKADALATLGLVPESTPEEITQAAGMWATRFARSGMAGVRKTNEPRRQALEAVAPGEAGIQDTGPNEADQSVIDAFRKECGCGGQVRGHRRASLAP